MADSHHEASDGSCATGTSSMGEDKAEQYRILDALRHNNFKDFKDLLRHPKVDPKYVYPEPHYGTLLEIASRRPYGQPFVELLLEKVHPNVNPIKPEPIHHAAKRGIHQVLRTLLRDRRIRANAYDSQGRTALHMVCLNVTPKRVEDYKECVRLLMDNFKPCDVNRTDNNGFTAIHAAARPPSKKTRPSCGNEDAEEEDEATEQEKRAARRSIIRFMLEFGRDVLDLDSVRAKGRTALEDLMINYPDLEEFLPTRGDAFNADPHSALANALRDRRIEMFKALLEQTDEDGNPRLDPNHWYGPPLHATCLELACKKRDGVEFVKALLNAGADPNTANRLDEKFPIHFACEKALLSNLKALFDSKDRSTSRQITDPNSTDTLGNTPLHYIVQKWSQSDSKCNTERGDCLMFLLSRPNTDVNRKNNDGNTPLMLAINSKIEFVVKNIIEKKGTSLNLSLRQGNKDLRQMIEDNYDCLKSKLPSSLNQIQEDNENINNTLFQLLYKLREDEFTEKLETSRPTDLSSINDGEFTLLQRAAKFGMAQAVKALLEAGEDPNKTFSNNRTPPAILAIHNHYDSVIDILLGNSKFKINATDSKGNTLLYYAVRNPEKSFEIILKLLKHGADPTICNKLGKVCFDREKLQLVLDQCVQTNGVNARFDNYELILDYRLLTSNTGKVKKDECGMVSDSDPEAERLNEVEKNDENHGISSEMHFLHLMSKYDDLGDLLKHPVASSFLQMKWDRVKILANVNLGIYVAFVLFFNMYIMNSRFIKDYFIPRNDSNHSNFSSIAVEPRLYPFISCILLALITLLLWIYLLLREIIQFIWDQEKYFQSYENYLDWSILLFSFVAVLMPIIQPSNEMIPVINVLSIMLSCSELLVLLSRISHFAKYIKMLNVVVRNYVWPLLSYCIIVIAFGLSFHTLLGENHKPDQHGNTTDSTEDNSRNGFEIWYVSILKTLVMMTGELDFDTFPKKSALSIILFLFFVLLVTVILLNLLIGLAVSDTQKIEQDAEELLVKTRIEVVLYAESILVNLYNADCWILRKLKASQKLRERLERTVLFPQKASEKRGRVRPNESGEIVLGQGVTGGHKVDREWLDQATQIISKRSDQKAESDVTLRNLKETLDSLSQMIRSRVAALDKVQVPQVNQPESEESLDPTVCLDGEESTGDNDSAF